MFPKPEAPYNRGMDGWMVTVGLTSSGCPGPLHLPRIPVPGQLLPSLDSQTESKATADPP